jgi:hypothetical protein
MSVHVVLQIAGFNSMSNMSNIKHSQHDKQIEKVPVKNLASELPKDNFFLDTAYNTNEAFSFQGNIVVSYCWFAKSS